MASLCFKALDEASEAENMLRAAREIFPDHPLVQPDMQQGNLIVVAAVGIGPWMQQGSFWNVNFHAVDTPEGEYRMSS